MLTLYRGDDYAGQVGKTLTINLKIDDTVDVTGLKAYFEFYDIKKEFTNLTHDNKWDIDISHNQSKKYPLGISFAKIHSLDSSGKIRTFANRIPVLVTTDLRKVYGSDGLDSQDVHVYAFVSWDSITNKPDKFPSTITMVEGLEEALKQAGKVKTVNNVEPDTDGNIQLNAGNIDYGENSTVEEVIEDINSELGNKLTSDDVKPIQNDGQEIAIIGGKSIKAPAGGDISGKVDVAEEINIRNKTIHIGFNKYDAIRDLHEIDIRMNPERTRIFDITIREFDSPDKTYEATFTAESLLGGLVEHMPEGMPIEYANGIAIDFHGTKYYIWIPSQNVLGGESSSPFPDSAEIVVQDKYDQQFSLAIQRFLDDRNFDAELNNYTFKIIEAENVGSTAFKDSINTPKIVEIISRIARGSMSWYSYNDIRDKPKINGVELKGDINSEDLDLWGRTSPQSKLDSDAAFIPVGSGDIEIGRTYSHNGQLYRAKKADASLENIDDRNYWDRVIIDELLDNKSDKTSVYTKAEVDDKISQSEAHYLTKRIGEEGHYSYPQFATHADLAAAKAAHTEENPQFFYGAEGHTPDKNDYCVVLADETHNGATTRYAFVGEWNDNGYFRYQYTINQTAFTEEQWAAINSMISRDEDGNLIFNGNTIATPDGIVIPKLTGADIPVSPTNADSIDTALGEKLSISDINQHVFPPETHSHTMGEINGLGNALDGKLDVETEGTQKVIHADVIEAQGMQDLILRDPYGNVKIENPIITPFYFNEGDKLKYSGFGRGSLIIERTGDKFLEDWEKVVVRMHDLADKLTDADINTLCTACGITTTGKDRAAKLLALFTENPQLFVITSQDITDFLETYKPFHGIVLGSDSSKKKVGYWFYNGDVYGNPQGIYHLEEDDYTGVPGDAPFPFVKTASDGFKRLIDLFGESNSRLVSTIEDKAAIVLTIEQRAEDGQKFFYHGDTKLDTFAKLYEKVATGRVIVQATATKADTSSPVWFRPHMFRPTKEGSLGEIRFDATGTIKYDGENHEVTRNIQAQEKDGGGYDINDTALTELASKGYVDGIVGDIESLLAAI